MKLTRKLRGLFRTQKSPNDEPQLFPLAQFHWLKPFGTPKCVSLSAAKGIGDQLQNIPNHILNIYTPETLAQLSQRPAAGSDGAGLKPVTQIQEMTSGLAARCQEDLLSALPIKGPAREYLANTAAILAAANQLGAILRNDMHLARTYLTSIMLNQWLLTVWCSVLDGGLGEDNGFKTPGHCPPLAEILPLLQGTPSSPFLASNRQTAPDDTVVSKLLHRSEPVVVHIKPGEPTPPGLLVAEILEAGNIYDNNLLPHIGPEVRVENDLLCMAFLPSEHREPIFMMSRLGLTLTNYRQIGPNEHRWARVLAEAVLYENTAHPPSL